MLVVEELWDLVGQATNFTGIGNWRYYIIIALYNAKFCPSLD